MKRRSEPQIDAVKRASNCASAVKIEGHQFEYDVALSFANEDRTYVEQVAEFLRDNKIAVFYDWYEEVSLWGKDLYEHLDSVYRFRARYCVIFISARYAAKLWTKHERASAQARAFAENREYILPARFDDTEIPGILPTTGYVDLRAKSPRDLGQLILQKLRDVAQNEPQPVTATSFKPRPQYRNVPVGRNVDAIVRLIGEIGRAVASLVVATRQAVESALDVREKIRYKEEVLLLHEICEILGITAGHPYNFVRHLQRILIHKEYGTLPNSEDWAAMMRAREQVQLDLARLELVLDKNNSLASTELTELRKLIVDQRLLFENLSACVPPKNEIEWRCLEELYHATKRLSRYVEDSQKVLSDIAQQFDANAESRSVRPELANQAQDQYRSGVTSQQLRGRATAREFDTESLSQYLPDALHAIAKLSSDEARAHALSLLLSKLAQTTDRESVHAITTLLIENASRIADHKDRAYLLMDAASRKLQIGHRDDARETALLACDAAKQVTSSRSRGYALRDVALLLAKAGDGESAWETVKLLRNDTFRMWTMGDILKEQTDSGDIAAANATLERMSVYGKIVEFEEGPSTLVVAQLSLGRIGAAIEATEQIPFDYDRNPAWGWIAAALNKAGDLPSAQAVAQRITSPDIRADVFRVMAECSFGQGNTLAGRSSLEQSLSSIELISDLDHQLFCLRQLSQMLVRVTELAEARKILSRMLIVLEGEKTIRGRTLWLLDVAAMYWDAADASSAKAIGRRVRDLIRLENDARRKVDLLSEAAVGLLVIEGPVASKQLFSEAEQAISDIPTIKDKASGWLTLAKSWHHSGDVESAKRAVMEAFGLARDLRGDEREFLLSSVADQLLLMNVIDLIPQVTKEITGQWKRSQIKNEINLNSKLRDLGGFPGSAIDDL